MICQVCWKPQAIEQEVDALVLVKRCGSCAKITVLPWDVLVGLAANYGPREMESRFPGVIESTCNFYEVSEETLWGQVEDNYQQLDSMRGDSV